MARQIRHDQRQPLSEDHVVSPKDTSLLKARFLTQTEEAKKIYFLTSKIFFESVLPTFHSILNQSFISDD